MATRKIRLRWVLLILLLVAVGLFIRWDRRRSIQAIHIVKAERQDIHSGVITNGKAEPVEYRDIRSEVGGEITNAFLHDGDNVKSGQKVFEIRQPEIQSEIEHARAELSDARESLRLLKQGGTAAEIRELRSQIDSAKRERDEAAQQVAQNERLVEKGAVARIELEQSRSRLAKAESSLSLLQQKLNRGNDPEEIARAEARVQADEAALKLSEQRQRSSTVTAPLDGIIYSISVRPGDYVHSGDLLARVGDFRKIRVRVYVDEPDLGRIAKNQPVVVTWDGLPGREWRGEVERMPSEVREMGTRRVGEVSCTLENPKLELLPNMSLNVEIITESKANALTIPREALFGGEQDQRVFVVRDGVLARQPVETGVTNATQVEIRQGLTEGDEVAVPGEVPLREGMRVRNAAT